MNSEISEIIKDFFEALLIVVTIYEKITKLSKNNKKSKKSKRKR